MNLFSHTAPKDHKSDEIIHPTVSEIFNNKTEELKPVFSNSDTIVSEEITGEYNTKQTLYHIKNFCSAYLNFQNSYDDLLKLDTSKQNYSSRFTHPINEIKFDMLDKRYIKTQEYLLSMYKYEEVDFKLYIVENESVMPIYDRISIKDNKYYIQPEVENIIKRLMLSKIITEREIVVIDMLNDSTYKRECLEKFEFFNSMVKLGINDYQQCYNCRFKIICLKHHHA